MNDYANPWTVTKGEFFTNNELINKGISNYKENRIKEATKWFRCAFTSKFQTIDNYVDYIHLLVKSNCLEEAAKALNTFNELYPISENPKSIIIYLPAAALAIALNEKAVARKYLEEYIIYSQFNNDLKSELPTPPPYWSLVKATDLELTKNLETEKQNSNKLAKLAYYITMGKKHFKENYLSWLKKIIHHTTNNNAKQNLLKQLSLIFKLKGDDELGEYFS